MIEQEKKIGELLLYGDENSPRIHEAVGKERERLPSCSEARGVRLATQDPEPSQEFGQLDGLPIATLSISSLVLDDSPRQGGEDEEHIRLLAELEVELPPIVVHGQSMRVIDGIHRVRAAFARGAETIEARIYNGTADDAFVLAVRMNIDHGLPLARADRTAAAERIIGTHPQWSNRVIAKAVGLSAGTVAKVRQRSSAQSEQSNTRIGMDGRVRPVTSVAGRLKAAELLAEKPTSSIRAIAKEAGVSSSTVHDVRQRLRAGQPAVPEHSRVLNQPPPSKPPNVSEVDVAAILADLRRDPSLQFRDPGRSLLRCLDRYRVEMAASSKFVETVPDHCAGSVAKLAREYARVWTEVAAQLEQRCLDELRAPILHSRP